MTDNTNTQITTPATTKAKVEPKPAFDVDGVLVEPLVAYIERIERLMEEKKGISDDIKEIYSTAKGNGYDVKTIRQIIKLRAMDEADRAEAEVLLDIYKRATGMAITDDE